MNFLGNLLWFILGGFIVGLLYILLGILYCCTIIFIPFGYQLMKLGVYAMFPFGTRPVFKEESMGCLNLAFNIIWIAFGGVELAMTHLAIGVVLCCTIIGIPFGLQHFKLAKYALIPFGQHEE